MQYKAYNLTPLPCIIAIAFFYVRTCIWLVCGVGVGEFSDSLREVQEDPGGLDEVEA